MQILSFPQAETPPELQAQVTALHRQAWPDPAEAEDAGHDPALRPVTMLLASDGIVLATLAILSKDLEHAGQRFAASGLSTVVTDSQHRGRGYGRRLVVAARHAIADSQQDLAIFTCDRELGPFYLDAGWQLLPGTVLIGGTAAEPFPSDQFDKLTLGAFFSARATAAAATFYGARIALHSGLHDRLW